ncbi:hypothetical protein AAV35_012170 [Salimicrobium jeotgali]|uniref:Uncharacterized protein n=1 Tax=Salimicrobium jeotgali TaxID=1230341 RepID=K2FJ48_9BACI|nr:permease prefix domain 1-containing protein [Salimicrobium jeotgali]AKG05448.1 hypothetical protein AAV35_012170 [Salimicrobium jeotgali]EKE31086.1 hypothetical protein MJ3_10331 [Salimicrobium jeotgali]MBM7697355.1 hypothetical protein [Salimicrobium jeotgali]
MQEVSRYVNNIYKKANPNNPETLELKKETEIHLIDSVKELMTEGYSRKEAFLIATERFGGTEQSNQIIFLMELQEKSFAKKLLNVSIFGILIAITCLIVAMQIGSINDQKFADLGYSILESPNQMTELTNEESLFILGTSFHSNADKTKSLTLTKNNWLPSWVKSELVYSSGNSFVRIQTIDVRVIGVLLFAIGLSIYYTLFAIWGCIKLHNENKLTIKWVLSLTALNILGYSLFLIQKHIVERRMKNAG